jgi:GrpB-like predicted nucleotidyltransferase (UPF0157 family)
MQAAADTNAVKVREAPLLRREAFGRRLGSANDVAGAQRIDAMRTRDVCDGLRERVAALGRADCDCARGAVLPAERVDSESYNGPAYHDCERGERFPRHSTSLSAFLRQTVLDGPITLVEYDPVWPELYAQEAGRIAAALGDRALLVEHVGSTSVPGLAAKPRIDIVLAVDDSSDEQGYVPALESAGYVLRIREPGWHEHRVFKRSEVDVNLHVFSAGCVEIDRMIGFRDHLRSNSADRALYERTKRDLAGRTWKYMQHYADAKTELVEEILERASGYGRTSG